MNIYWVGVILAVLILGLFVIYASLSEQEYGQGYRKAVDDHQRQIQLAMWRQYFDQTQGGDDEEEQQDE